MDNVWLWTFWLSEGVNNNFGILALPTQVQYIDWSRYLMNQNVFNKLASQNLSQLIVTIAERNKDQLNWNGVMICNSYLI